MWTGDRQQATVVERVATQPIFDVFEREIGYERVGRLRVTWWRHKLAEDHLRVTVEAILAAARVRWR